MAERKKRKITDGDLARVGPGGDRRRVAAPLLVGGLARRGRDADRGVIMLRKMVREGIETTAKGGRPKGVFSVEDADKVIEFGCFTGVKPKSNGSM